MKRIAFLSLSFITLFFSAMYHSTTLVTLFFAEMMIMVCMWMISIYMKRHLTVSFPASSAVEENTEDIWCSCNVMNRGRLPVTRFKIRLWIHYRQEKKGKKGYLYGSANPGINRLRFGVRAGYCGLICVEMDELIVYDYMALFPAFSERKQKMQIAVLPSVPALQIEFSSFFWKDDLTRAEGTIPASGEDMSEIRQLREHRTGDSLRHIHWNQSAKTDKIWIKEYEKEAYSCFALVLKIENEHQKDLQAMDAFYRLLYALLSGLTDGVDVVKVFWCSNGQTAETEVWDERQSQELLLQLYEADAASSEEEMRRLMQSVYDQRFEHYLTLDSGLNWCFDETRIFCFSAEHLEEEIRHRIFTL